jgi:hypothetical protein
VADNQTENPEAIEQDIERTQDAMGDTIEKIERKLNPKDITRSVLGDSGQEWMREALRLARDNPIPLAMIAAGTVWLLATSESPLIRRLGDRISDRLTGSGGSLRSRGEEPAPIGPPASQGDEFDRRAAEM